MQQINISKIPNTYYYYLIIDTKNKFYHNSKNTKVKIINPADFKPTSVNNSDVSVSYEYITHMSLRVRQSMCGPQSAGY